MPPQVKMHHHLTTERDITRRAKDYLDAYFPILRSATLAGLNQEQQLRVLQQAESMLDGGKHTSRYARPKSQRRTIHLDRYKLTATLAKGHPMDCETHQQEMKNQDL